jgi:hypothetical protein
MQEDTLTTVGPIWDAIRLAGCDQSCAELVDLDQFEGLFLEGHVAGVPAGTTFFKVEHDGSATRGHFVPGNHGLEDWYDLYQIREVSLITPGSDATFVVLITEHWTGEGGTRQILVATREGVDEAVVAEAIVKAVAKQTA